jgi:ATP-dependent Clp protease ATP-binding subunit ClpC
MEKFNVSKMVGAPPGYVGYESGGDLTEKIRRKPYSVVLFDEIEKAHPDVFNMLLQILDEGRITDTLGNKVDFRNTILILTSNIGTDHISNKGNLGFSDQLQDDEKNREYLLSELKNYFKPEFLNRIDEIVLFKQLNEDILHAIIDKLVDEMNENLLLKGLRFTLTPEVKDAIIARGFDVKYGARSLARSITKYIEIPATDKLLEENILLEHPDEQVEVLADMLDGEVRFQIRQTGIEAAPVVAKKKRKKADLGEEMLQEN